MSGSKSSSEANAVIAAADPDSRASATASDAPTETFGAAAAMMMLAAAAAGKMTAEARPRDLIAPRRRGDACSVQPASESARSLAAAVEIETAFVVVGEPPPP